jgi:pyochelin biosynthesis protein PchC
VTQVVGGIAEEHAKGDVLGEPADRWLRCFVPVPEARTRLVCFPHAGGTASYFLPMARMTAPDLEVSGVQYPGRHDRRDEKCVEDLLELADRIALALIGSDDGRPVALFGHSLGSVLAYEVGRRLEADGRIRPLRLFASGRRAPSENQGQKIHTLGEAAFLEHLRQLGGIDPRILQEPELLQMALPAVRADYTAIESYRHPQGPVLSCPIDVLIGLSDPEVSAEGAELWAPHTTGDFAVHAFPGGHFYLAEQASRVVNLVRRSC